MGVAGKGEEGGGLKSKWTRHMWMKMGKRYLESDSTLVHAVVRRIEQQGTSCMNLMQVYGDQKGCGVCQ